MSQCSESPSAAVSGGEIMLFGVRVKVDPMRKSVSMNNLSEYVPLIHNTNNTTNEVVKAEDGGSACYASADEAVPQPSNGSRERKRGVPWTEDEHKLFLIGLQEVGKGDWRGISRNYVKTRTPTQVASHAQKYFLRRTNLNRRRRRSSLFDITTDSVTPMPIEEGSNHQEIPTQTVVPPTTLPPPLTSNINGFSVVPFPVLLSMQGGNPMENSVFSQSDGMNTSSPILVRPVHILPMPTSSQQIPVETSNLSLRLSLSSGQDQSSSTRMSNFKNGDSSTISVA
ncbi:hypothetical protein ACJIZ3_009876 [Penstemon smallii]|uniref:Uncharacterized protein n=1 Tax=Penstemon smallii TaxID=265156 RepID=A0ABD3TEL3_9LAMI